MGRNEYSDNRSIRTVFLLVVLLCFAPMASARTDKDSLDVKIDGTPEVVRPVTSTWLGEFGSAHVSDTYLTPLRYSGWQAAISYSRRQAMRFSPDLFIMQLDGEISMANMLNPAGNARMYDIGFNLSWSMMRRWQMPVNGFSIAVGGTTGLNLGALYLARNGNNPVSAKADWNVGLAGYIAYNTNLFRTPVQLRYSMSLPAAGVFFSPDYGELYYEIYLGNDSGLAHAAWWGNHFRYDHRFQVMLAFSGTTLNIGYHGNILSSKACGIVTNMNTHMLSIGITTEWMSLSPKTRLSDAVRIISANY